MQKLLRIAEIYYYTNSTSLGVRSAQPKAASRRSAAAQAASCSAAAAAGSGLAGR